MFSLRHSDFREIFHGTFSKEAVSPKFWVAILGKKTAVGNKKMNLSNEVYFINLEYACF